jgi:uncharacterized protein involved in oxidation of intracellular sulfur
MAKTLFILNDPPYGTERGYNALRLAVTLSKREGKEGKRFRPGVCGSCMDARGIAEAELAEGSHRSNLKQLTDWTQWADQRLVF